MRVLAVFAAIVGIWADSAQALIPGGPFSEDGAEFREFVQVMKRGGRYVFESAVDAKTKPSAYVERYRNGDAQYLFGQARTEIMDSEWAHYFSVAKWMSRHYFRPIFTAAAQTQDVQAAVRDPKTTVVIWASDSNRKTGQIMAANGKALPANIFTENAGSRFKFVVLSNQGAESTVRYYSLPPHFQFWADTAAPFPDATRHLHYLISERFDHDLEQNTGAILRARTRARPAKVLTSL